MADAGHRAELVALIQRIRRRWRVKLMLRGAAIVIAGTLLALFASASGLEALRFSASAIIGFRIADRSSSCCSRGGSSPLMRRVSDRRSRCI